MRFKFIDSRRLGGRTGTKAFLFVLGALCCQWFALLLFMGLLWSLKHTLGAESDGANLQCISIVLSSLSFTCLLFSSAGLKTQYKMAEHFESLVSDLINGRKHTTEPTLKVLFWSLFGNMGRDESPYPPPPKNPLA